MFCTLPLPSDQIPRFLAELAQKIILLICVKFPREKVALVPCVSFNAFASLLIPYCTKSRNTKILVQDLCTLPCVLASETASDVCTCVHCTGAGIDQCHTLCSFFFCCCCCYKQRHTLSFTGRDSRRRIPFTLNLLSWSVKLIQFLDALASLAFKLRVS